MFGVTILGNNSALPAYDRHPTSQIITMSDQLFLMDCGEGTQMQMNTYKIKRSRINYIFISHMHGDHYFGLPGLLTSYGLLGRVNELHLFAPSALKTVIDLMLSLSDTELPYKLNFHALDGETHIVEEEKFTVECFRVFHRIDCWGFIFRERKLPRKINAEAVKEYKVPIAYYEKLQQGLDYVMENGKFVSNELLTFPNKPARSYAFCSDTAYNESIAKKIKDVTMVYHEATYLKDNEEKATKRFHSTSVQAANIAKLANAQHLLVGHFSSNYQVLDPFLTEAQEIFPDTQLAIEGETYLIM